MIIEKLLELVIKIFGLLTSAIDIPALPDDVSDILNTVLEYLNTGVQLLACYTNLKYLLVLFGIIVAVDVGISVYHFVMWILRKIPMLGIS